MSKGGKIVSEIVDIAIQNGPAVWDKFKNLHPVKALGAKGVVLDSIGAILGIGSMYCITVGTPDIINAVDIKCKSMKGE